MTTVTSWAGLRLYGQTKVNGQSQASRDGTPRSCIRLVFASIACYVDSVVPRKKINLDAARVSGDDLHEVWTSDRAGQIVRLDWDRKSVRRVVKCSKVRKQNRPLRTDAAQCSE